MSNPLKLQFPQDRFGNLSRLKSEGLRSVERLYGNEDKLDTFLATLRVLAQHAKARCAQQKAARAQALSQEEPEIEPEVDQVEPEPEPEVTPEPEPEPVPEPEAPAEPVKEPEQPVQE